MADARSKAAASRAGDGEDKDKDGGRETVHHTVTACVRCRQVSLPVEYATPYGMLT